MKNAVLQFWRSHLWVRRLTKWAALPFLAAFALLLLVDLVIMPLYTRHGKEFPAPQLEGRSLEVARELVNGIGSKMQIAERRYSPEYPDGTILEQRPPPGALIKRGRVFDVVLSRGSELIDVPRVRGYTARQAELIIAQVGFTVGGRGTDVDDSLPAGTVVRTVPRAGTSLPRGSVVNILVNEPGEPTTTWCPNLVGLNIEEAREILRERRLLVGDIDRRYDPTLLPGTIISQSFSPGVELAIGSEINLVISRDR